MVKVFANSVAPDEMQRYGPSLFAKVPIEGFGVYTWLNVTLFNYPMSLVPHVFGSNCFNINSYMYFRINKYQKILLML